MANIMHNTPIPQQKMGTRSEWTLKCQFWCLDGNVFLKHLLVKDGSFCLGNKAYFNLEKKIAKSQHYSIKKTTTKIIEKSSMQSAVFLFRETGLSWLVIHKTAYLSLYYRPDCCVPDKTKQKESSS